MVEKYIQIRFRDTKGKKEMKNTLHICQVKGENRKARILSVLPLHDDHYHNAILFCALCLTDSGMGDYMYIGQSGCSTVWAMDDFRVVVNSVTGEIS